MLLILIAIDPLLIIMTKIFLKTKLLCGSVILGMTLMISSNIASSEPIIASGIVQIYDISPGSLKNALDLFVQQTETQIYFDAAVIHGVTTNGLQGKFSIKDALDQLLVGSNLQAVSRTHGYIIKTSETALPSVKENSISLSSSLANSTLLPSRTISADIGSNYLAKRSVVATKTDTLLRDTPQSISVITQDLIKDQAMQSIADVVRYVPGVGMSQGEGNTDAPIFRGNKSTADFYVDGIRDDASYFRDLYNMESVEILKGPNGMIFGRGGSGGVINRVSKEAGWEKIHTITLQGGTFGAKRALIDIGQGINEIAAFRLNGMYENSDTYRKGVSLERYGINPTLTIKPTDQTKIVLSGEYFHDNRTADRGIPSFNGLPMNTRRSAFFGDPSRSNSNITTKSLSSVIEHEFNSGVTLRNRTRGAVYNKFYQNIYPYETSTDGTEVDLAAYNSQTKRGNIFNQTDLMYKLNTGFLEHRLLSGIEVGRQVTDNLRRTGYFNDDTYGGPPEHEDDPEDDVAMSTVRVPSSNPITRDPVAFRLDANGITNRAVAKVTGIYVQDQIKLGSKFQTILGLRYDKFELNAHNNRNGVDLKTSNGLLSPRAGLIYKPIEPISFYTSYSLSYVPRAGDQLDSLEISNQTLSPERFINLEVGAKLDIRTNLALTVAAYRLDRTNIAIPDPFNATRSLLVKGQRSEGIEVGINGRIIPSWTVMGGYAYQDGKITQDQGEHGMLGATLAQLPKHTFSLWNRYNFSSMPGWGVGLGVITRTQMFASIDNTVNLPSYTRLDAALYGKLSRNLRFQLNVENMLNAHYIISANNNNNIMPGSPIMARGTLVYEF